MAVMTYTSACVRPRDFQDSVRVGCFTVFRQDLRSRQLRLSGQKTEPRHSGTAQQASQQAPLELLGTGSAAGSAPYTSSPALSVHT